MSRGPQPSQVIFQTANIDDKIYIKEQTGKFQKIRRYLASILTIIFIGLPFVPYQGQQAILFDVGAQKLHLFAWILYPHDLLIFVYLFIIAAFALFYIANRYGRIWCGYLCPQTIWSMLFFWLQFRVEGNAQAQKRLDKLPFGAAKVIRKGIKHGLWLLVSLFTATTFMSYFLPVSQLYSELFTGQLEGLYWGWILTFMACTYINAGWIKEKMCEHMCPYSRFQSAMVNEATKQITYNNSRGEPRGPRKLSKPSAQVQIHDEVHKQSQIKQQTNSLGDCVDCNLCVQVCPVGIDIRDGFQYECISCGLCIDACDQVMSRFNYAKGLIRYHGKVQGKRSHSLAYVGLIGIFSVLFIIWMANRPMFELNIIKDRNVLYRVVDEQRIENTFELKLINKTQLKETFTVSLKGVQGFELVSNKPIEIDADSRASVLVNVLSPIDHKAKFVPFEFVLRSDNHAISSKSVFHGK
ncbi:cytochrome c oxidase accessory protein CcoG [Thalassotalea sp. Y01]|uniref:cytochrome c oxidase accessory protein CcoG n=1 Tax=Thalassotalea sp. Y01 TaxID=2729613 RepID=UPI00145F2CDA|nr:cytochrome c oxidase accessory protein CcoG [Thalassotalea sp. Y01]NMP15415.1 cytochrome c oxidase accessory protein CcoG [Thalassotalea sp. Y01]